MERQSATADLARVRLFSGAAPAFLFFFIVQYTVNWAVRRANRLGGIGITASASYRVFRPGADPGIKVTPIWLVCSRFGCGLSTRSRNTDVSPLRNPTDGPIRQMIAPDAAEGGYFCFSVEPRGF